MNLVIVYLVSGFKTPPLCFQLSAEDLTLLGKLAFNRGFYDRSYEFLIAAESKAIDEKDNDILESTRVTLKGK